MSIEEKLLRVMLISEELCKLHKIMGHNYVNAVAYNIQYHQLNCRYSNLNLLGRSYNKLFEKNFTNCLVIWMEFNKIVESIKQRTFSRVKTNKGNIFALLPNNWRENNIPLTKI